MNECELIVDYGAPQVKRGKRLADGRRYRVSFATAEETMAAIESSGLGSIIQTLTGLRHGHRSAHRELLIAENRQLRAKLQSRTEALKVEMDLRRRMEAVLAESEERYRQMAAHLRDSVEALQRTLHQTIQAVASTVETRDPYTAGHQRRVSKLAAAIATEMGLPPAGIDCVAMAAAIHDIGKVSLPAEILSKPSRLSELEFRIVKDHPQAGYDILKQVDFQFAVADIVLQHHERMNGTGYPRGLNGQDILMEARIVAVADVVEAMASHRPYRPALGMDKALEEIRKNRAILYDAGVVDAAIHLLSHRDFQLAD